MLTLITTGRDDDYGGSGFLDRLYLSILKNTETLEKLGIEYEYLLVEWNPIRVNLLYHEKFKELFNTKKLINIVVKQSVAIQENLGHTNFYEYFAKNVGIRNAKYDNLLLINSDIILSEKSFGEIKKILETGMEKYFYRLRYRSQLNMNLSVIKTEDVHYPQNADAVICGYCSGDLLFIRKDVIIEYGQGYDETNPSHRTRSQTGMDGEILWNLLYKGITLKFIESDYSHINHDKIGVTTDGTYNMGGYINKSNWGFIDYPKNIINEKLIEIG